MPVDLDPATVPPEFLKEGHDWFAVFNPDVHRVMDINLSCKFTHDKSVNLTIHPPYPPPTHSFQSRL